jgi:hypothetical protein
MKKKNKHIKLFNHKKDYYSALLEEYSNQSKYKTFKSFVVNKASKVKDISKNVIGAFKKEGSETSDMLSVFNRQLRKKLNLKSRKDMPTKQELDEALNQLKDIPKLLPFVLVMLTTPIPGSSTMYTIFAYFLKKKSNGKINLLPDSFNDVLSTSNDRIK